ncbi:DinB family protein [Deinococcus pimensis]|uniref:DinB family protein n=1 Tax=Deinococcus pimensis TaxID=309888 RepID=UPI0004883F7F|nr:DinB family protein [Deinococcus pimensis]
MPYSGQEYARSFVMHRAALVDLLDQVPEDRGEFSAWEGGMTFRALADHLAGASDRFARMMAGETPSPVEPSADLAEARERLRAGLESTRTFLAGLSDEQLARRVQAFGGREMPAYTLADFLVQHEAHHKGQVWMMARMIGLKPPMFVRLG